MKKRVLITNFLLLFFLSFSFVTANNVTSSTIIFEGSLTDDGDGSYSGVIDAVAGNYYIPGGPGATVCGEPSGYCTPDGRNAIGGWDVYAKEGGTAYYDDTVQGIIGADHDAYSSGGGWGDFWDPDVPDWNSYQLKLENNKWYLQFKGTNLGTPMSGSVNWDIKYCSEEDVGSYLGTIPADPDANDGDAALNGGGSQAWDMDWTWGSEVIPLEYPGFNIGIVDIGGSNYRITLTPSKGPITNLNTGKTYGTIQRAIDEASSGDSIRIEEGIYEEEGQIIIGKDLTILGEDKNKVTIKPSEDTGSSGDSRGWFLIEDGIEFYLSDVTLDGIGYKIYQGIRHKGYGTVSNCVIKNIKYNEGGPHYSGVGLAVFGNPNGNVDVTNCEFSEIGRIGVLYFGLGVTNSLYNNNKYTGKGEGDWLDYGVEVGAGATVTINNSEISNCKGVASSDGSTSAGILVTTYYGGGTTAEILNNKIITSTTGIAVGYDGSDTSDVTIYYNDIIGNGEGVDTTAPSVDARYNWWGDCSGPYHPTTNPEGLGDEVSDNVDYSNWLQKICINEKASLPTCVLETDNITLYANISSDVCIEEVIFSVLFGNEWVNFTGEKDFGGIANYSYVLTSDLLNKSEEINWTVYAKDCFNHSTQNGIESFYVNSRTVLTVIPVEPDGLNGWYNNTPEFTLTNPDATNLWYRWEGGSIIDYLNPFGLENAPNNAEETGLKLYLEYWSNVCNETPKEELFSIDLSNPIIKNLFPANNSKINSVSEISAYIDNEVGILSSGIDGNSIIVMLDGAPIDFNISVKPNLDLTISHTLENLGDGIHNIHIEVTDNAGRYNEMNWEFEIDSEIIVLKVNSPNEPVYSDRRVPFNISVLGGEAKRLGYIDWLSSRPRLRTLCRNCEEYGFSKERTKSFSDGEHNLTILAIDEFENTNEINISFFVDSNKPRISKTEPRKRYITNGSNFYIKFREENPEELKLIIEGVENLLDISECEESRGYFECYFNLDLTIYNGQEIDYYFSVEDIVGSVDESKPTNIIVDTDAPIINNEENFYNSDSKYIYFEINISEENLDEVLFSYDYGGRTREKKLCSRLKDGICEKRIRFKEDYGNMKVRILDEAGNSIEREVVLN